MNKHVLILGAGVSGLTCAIELLTRGYQVTIWAKDLPPNTTSNKAAAVWYPYLCYPREKAIPWARTTYEHLATHQVGKPGTGCIFRTVTEIFGETQSEPWWKAAYPGIVERPPASELPTGYEDAYRLKSIVIDTSVYMEYLLTTAHKLGAEIVRKVVNDVHECFTDFDTVINCTGLGSKELFHDDKLFPVRGQMMRIKANGYEKVVVDDEGPNSLAVAIPRLDDIMLGGTAQKNNWNTQIDPADSKEILRKVAIIAPDLKNIEILGESVGLRPARDAVRLEVEYYGNKAVVHNYGHGGAGFTLSWGCAQDVVALIQQL